jgi:hypothetical protein
MKDELYFTPSEKWKQLASLDLASNFQPLTAIATDGGT